MVRFGPRACVVGKDVHWNDTFCSGMHTKIHVGCVPQSKGWQFNIALSTDLRLVFFCKMGSISAARYRMQNCAFILWIYRSWKLLEMSFESQWRFFISYLCFLQYQGCILRLRWLVCRRKRKRKDKKKKHAVENMNSWKPSIPAIHFKGQAFHFMLGLESDGLGTNYKRL